VAASGVTTEADVRSLEHQSRLLGERIEKLEARVKQGSEGNREMYRRECDELAKESQRLRAAIQTGLEALEEKSQSDDFESEVATLLENDGSTLGERIGLGILEEETDAGAILLFRELRLANAMQATAAGVFPAEANAETTALLALCSRLNPEATRDACAQISEWTA
jgi:hypothetical protein